MNTKNASGVQFQEPPDLMQINQTTSFQPPEKKYINQRLNIKIFYQEQLSVQPPENTIEERGTRIRDLVLREQLYLKKNFNKNEQELQKIHNDSTQRMLHIVPDEFTQSIDNQFKGMGKSRNEANSQLTQFNTESTALPPDSKRIQKLNVYLNHNPNISGRISNRVLKQSRFNLNQSSETSIMQSYKQLHIHNAQESPKQFSQQLQSLIPQREFLNKSALAVYQQTSDARQTMSLIDTKSRQAFNQSFLGATSFGKRSNSVFRKNYARLVDPILQGKYKQIGSAFASSNHDRFGESYVPIKPLERVPGPGSYNNSIGITIPQNTVNNLSYSSIQKLVLSKTRRKLIQKQL